jgi:hypothetical protein
MRLIVLSNLEFRFAIAKEKRVIGKRFALLFWSRFAVRSVTLASHHHLLSRRPPRLRIASAWQAERRL